MNYRLVFHLVFLILAAVSLAMTGSGVLSCCMDGSGTGIPLLTCGMVLFLLAGGAVRLTRTKEKNAGMREGFAVVGISWLLVTLIGTIPLYFVTGMFWHDAFFETASGFSTTGSSVIDSTLRLRDGSVLLEGVESLPYGILFWRSLTHWLGGMGIVVLSLAILPVMNIGGQMLYNAEVSGIKSMQSKFLPRIGDTAKILWLVYVLLTVLQSVLMRLGGMDWFHAVNHGMSTIATGGFSTFQDSLAGCSAYLQWVMIVFMFLAGCNFVLHYHCLRGAFNSYGKDEEFRFYTVLVLAASLFVAVSLYASKATDTLSEIRYASDLSGTIRTAIFQVVSIITTSGFNTADYAAWPAAAAAVLYLLMFVSACGGSTSGGIKCVRVLLVWKYALSEIRRCLFPHMVQDIRISGTRYENTTIQKTVGFCALFIMLVLIFAVIIAAVTPGAELETALSASIASLANVGPGFGQVGPAATYGWMPPAAKIILGLEMLLGRLELYTLLVLMLPSFWKR